MRSRGSGRCFDSIRIRRQIPIENILLHGAIEEERFLLNKPDLPPQVIQGQIPDILAVDEHRSCLNIIKTHQQFQ